MQVDHFTNHYKRKSFGCKQQNDDGTECRKSTDNISVLFLIKIKTQGGFYEVHSLQELDQNLQKKIKLQKAKSVVHCGKGRTKATYSMNYFEILNN